MGRFDRTIADLRKTIENATDALASIEQGARQFVNDVETTEWWADKYQRIIDNCKDLIQGYEKHND